KELVGRGSYVVGSRRRRCPTSISSSRYSSRESPRDAPFRGWIDVPHGRQNHLGGSESRCPTERLPRLPPQENTRRRAELFCAVQEGRRDGIPERGSQI